MNLLDQIRANIRDALTKRAEHQAKIDAAISAAEERGEGALSEEEERVLTEARAAVHLIDHGDEERGIVGIKAMEAREAELVADEEARKQADALATRMGAPATPSPVSRVNEPDLYRDGGEHSWFSDAYRSQFNNDRDAGDRLFRHGQFEAERRNEQRDATVSAFGALIPPQYLTDQYAAIARAGRPFLNALTSLPLPSRGTTFNIPRGTTGTTVAEQSSEGDALSETDFDETTLAVSVKTYGGAQDISRQALERGEAIDRIIYNDLAAAYAAAVDSAYVALALSGVSATVAYTDASPTVAEIWPKLADAIQRVNANRYLPATAIFMHPRRWGWFTAALDSSNRPLVGLESVQNPMALGKAAEYGQVVGSIQGLPVVTDANMATNLGSGTDEDRIIVARTPDLLLWEEGDGAPRELRFDQPQGKKLVVEVAVYGYSAFTAGRYPTALYAVGGTGTVAPSF